MSEVINGLIKWYDGKKGYGFIKVDGRDKDVFFHAKQWNLVSKLPPVDNEPVTFTLVDGPKGAYATNINKG